MWRLCKSRKVPMLAAVLALAVILLVAYLPYSGRIALSTFLLPSPPPPSMKPVLPPTLSPEETARSPACPSVPPVQTATVLLTNDPSVVLAAAGNDDDTLLMETEAPPVKLPRVFCWITTMEKELNNKIKAINNTWVRRCDGHAFVLTKTSNLSLADVVDLGVPDGRGHLTAKTMKVMEYIYTHHLGQYDWFLKGDDDAFIVMENLKFLLSHYNSSEPIYTGHLFKKFHTDGYMSGGAGYVLSQQAVKVVVEQGIRVKGKCAADGGDEDVKLGLCLHKLGVNSHESIDKFDRESFHPFGALAHIGGPMPAGLDEYDRHPTKIGQDCCSQLAISFHYNTPQLIYLIEQMLYRTSVYGRRSKSTSAFKGFFKTGRAPPLDHAPK